jgi:hypothetical protein
VEPDAQNKLKTQKTLNMTFRKSIFAFIAISIAFNIAQMIDSQDASNEPSRRGFNRTQRSGEPGDLRKMATTGQRDAIGFFRSMLDTLIEDRVADPELIYVAGGSNGGMMTMNVVCRLADRIAGAGVLLATPPCAAEITWPKPAQAHVSSQRLKNSGILRKVTIIENRSLSKLDQENHVLHNACSATETSSSKFLELADEIKSMPTMIPARLMEPICVT